MRIEMGESLFYSWLRHVKECQVVQTNWTTSSEWRLDHEDQLKEIMSKTDVFFSEKYGYSIYKKTSTLSQLLQQAECDAIGIKIQDGVNIIYAVDVAFHESGLNYGTRDETIKKIIAKSLRTAMCIYGYLNALEAEIIFASPKIHKNVLNGVIPCLIDMQRIMDELGFRFTFRIIANDEFRVRVLAPILKASKGIADTNELFIRSYQLTHLLEKTSSSAKHPVPTDTIVRTPEEIEKSNEELSIGKVAQLVLRPLLKSDRVTPDEINQLQTKGYCKKIFNINYPLLVKTGTEYDKARYYKELLQINGDEYLMCSQWFERPEKNNRPYLMNWIRAHQ